MNVKRNDIMQDFVKLDMDYFHYYSFSYCHKSKNTYPEDLGKTISCSMFDVKSPVRCSNVIDI